MEVVVVKRIKRKFRLDKFWDNFRENLKFLVPMYSTVGLIQILFISQMYSFITLLLLWLSFIGGRIFTALFFSVLFTIPTEPINYEIQCKFRLSDDTTIQELKKRYRILDVQNSMLVVEEF